MNKHTPEPWVVEKFSPSWARIVRGDNRQPLHDGVMLAADAELIVACVNAMRGIDDPAAFVAAAEWVEEQSGEHYDGGRFCITDEHAMDALRAALAKLKEAK